MQGRIWEREPSLTAPMKFDPGVGRSETKIIFFFFYLPGFTALRIARRQPAGKRTSVPTEDCIQSRRAAPGWSGGQWAAMQGSAEGHGYAGFTPGAQRVVGVSVQEDTRGCEL